MPGPVVRSALERLTQSALLVGVWFAVVAAGSAALASCLLDAGPAWLCPAGAIAVSTAYSWALAARVGGRPVVAGLVALALGLVVVLSDDDTLRTGAAVLTCVVAATLGVMCTKPAPRWWQVPREVLAAVLVAGLGALAVVGFEPVVSVTRFEYVTLGLALLVGFAAVHRLGAGLHGLGRRGVAMVAIGTLLLALAVAYGELLRRYGTPGVVETVFDVVGWSRQHLGASPRPLETLLGVPALAWGCHMRARRRQGWWLCAFGVAATAPVASALVNTSVDLTERGLAVLYGVAAGLVLGAVAIRLDLAFTDPRRRRCGGRGGGRRAGEASVLRPEPGRTSALL